VGGRRNLDLRPPLLGPLQQGPPGLLAARVARAAGQRALDDAIDVGA
jgi:hypothetical protein